MYQSQHGFDHIRQSVQNMASQSVNKLSAQTASMGGSATSTFVPKSAQIVDEGKGMNGFTVFLGMVIFLISVATFYAAFSGHNARPIIAQIQPQPQPQQVRPVDTRPVIDASMQTWMDQVDRRMYQFEKNIQEWNHRVWLLAVAHNENATINADIDRRYHGGSSANKYIRFDNEWKMNRAPDSMRLTDEQKREMVR